MQISHTTQPDAYVSGAWSPTIQAESQSFIQSLCDEFQRNNRIDPSYYQKWDVKRGLRNADGTGVMAGVTQIGNVRGY